MESCVDIVQLTPTRKMVRIKQPGQSRHSTGTAIDFIEMTLEEAEQLSKELSQVMGNLIEEQQRDYIEKEGL